MRMKAKSSSSELVATHGESTVNIPVCTAFPVVNCRLGQRKSEEQRADEVLSCGLSSVSEL